MKKTIKELDEKSWFIFETKSRHDRRVYNYFEIEAPNDVWGFVLKKGKNKSQVFVFSFSYVGESFNIVEVSNRIKVEDEVRRHSLFDNKERKSIEVVFFKSSHSR